MKNTLKAVLVTLVLCLFSSFTPAQQNTLTGTTLAAALTDSNTTLRVTSATGITVVGGTTNTYLYIDNEMLAVLSVSGTSIGVSRGQNGTRASAHISGAVVYAGRGSWFYQVNPQGTCSLTGTAAILVSPYINVTNGQAWLCGLAGRWIPGFGNPGNSGVPVGLSSTVTAATATAISGPLFKLTGSTTITSYTIPVGGVGQNFCMIPDSTNTVSAGNNIALGSTLVVNKTICYTWDSAQAKFTPSY